MAENKENHPAAARRPSVEGNNKKISSLKTFFKFIKCGGLFLGIAVLCSFITIFVSYLQPQVIKVTIDSVFGDKPLSSLEASAVNLFGGISNLKSNLFIIPSLICAFALFNAFFNYIQRILTLNSSELIGKKLRDDIFIHIQNLPFSWHSTVQTGDIIQRCSQDVDMLKRFIAAQFVELFRVVIMIAVGLTLMFSMNVIMSAVLVGEIVFLLIFTALFYNKISKNFQLADEAEGALTAKLQENLTGIRVVRAFGRQAFEVEEFDKKTEYYTNLWLKLGKKLSIFWASGDFFAGLQMLTVLIMGAVFTVNGVMGLGAMLAFIFYNQYIIWPVRNSGRILAETSKIRIAVIRLEEILQAEAEKDNENDICSEIKGCIKFENVTFSYDGSREILKDISFEIKEGETFAVLGGTGSGKSTLVQLINRLYENYGGSILIDGVDIRKIKRKHLRKNIGLILQEPFLYSKKVNENIFLACPSANENDMKRYTRIASVDGDISEFKDGYDTLIGEKGVTLSGGQKQRIAIARTLIQKPPVVIFDDSLSAVDTETDYKIREALKNNLKNTTVILISHRITTLMHADNILVLDGGKTEFLGNHVQQMAHGGIYKRIFDLQTNIN